ncbi:hypothetical protein jhhlp_004424 [Lomentospora prolificans]|uniref:DNA polymerase alpha subunit B n=1 Tax=Lomentospora prolificans TaxID=41688 RepID=A0A2N3NBP9_9PEZI|nr:hypothetical protein jhhlp_004424 [Lomentospora prolificans]
MASQDEEASAALHNYFSPNAPLEPDVLTELISLLHLHGVSAEDLFYKWESYCMSLEAEANIVTLDAVRAFKQNTLDGLEKNNQTSKVPERRIGQTPRSVVKGGGRDVFNMLDGLVPGTPATARSKATGSLKKKPFETPSVNRVRSNAPASSPDIKTPSRPADNGVTSTPVNFNDRANAGEIIEVLNDNLKVPDPPFPYPEPRVLLSALADVKKIDYKPLAMKVSETSEALDRRIKNFMDELVKENGVDESAFGNAATKSTSKIIAVGRIASDSPEGKLNPASLVLETSMQTGNGLRIPLNVKKLKGFGVFPGQIVALKGSNASGHEFIADEVIELPLLVTSASSPADLEAHKRRLRGDPDAMDDDSEPAPLNVIFASGPYTPDDNLDYEALHAICGKAADTYADALVLTGPFLDIEHPLIASGDFDLPEDASYDPDTATMTTVFRHLVSPALNTLVQTNPAITVILVPSVRDVLAKHVSWPQDVIPRKDLGLPKAVRIIPNPRTLSLNEVVLGVSSQDILYELRHEELVVGNVAIKDSASRLSQYLIEQRHYFPLFPPTDRSKLPKTGTEEGKPPGAVLDAQNLELAELPSVLPDVMVIPSALQPFSRVVNGVLIINPGSLSKRRGAGSYARMTLYPRHISPEESSSALLAHKIFERARVDVMKI